MAVSAQSDLAARLAETAAQTIRSHKRAIKLGAGHLRSITVEIETRRSGEIVNSRGFFEYVSSHRAKEA
jgi:hypothetical protein